MKSILFALLLPVCALAQGPQNFTLDGHLQLNRPADWVYLRYVSADQQVIDSVQPKDGNFSFKGSLDEPTVAVLSVKSAPKAGEDKPARSAVQLFLEPSALRFNAKDSLEGFTLEGSKGQADFAWLEASRGIYDDDLNSLYEKYMTAKKEGRTADMQKLDKQMEDVQKKMQSEVYGQFVKRMPKSPVALYALKQYAGWEIDPDVAGPLFKTLPANVQKWPSAVQLQDRIVIARKTAIGQTALDFSQADTSGHAVSLSSFRGKYVLVDFWASWCGPCRAENPNVVKAYNKFKDKNFTILGVSLDRPTGRDRWLKAIHDDGLAWNHVSDLKFWDNAVAKEYGIRAIPQNLLIDPQGRIVAKNLNGEELDKKLGELVGN